jgi:hypothetical protein
MAGWAWDKNDPDSPINVDIYDGNTLLATVTANLFRQDLVNASKGKGNYGFAYTPPTSLRDGQTHSIQAKVSGTNFDLYGSPKEVTCQSGSSRVAVSTTT